MEDHTSTSDRNWYVLNFFRQGPSSAKKCISDFNKEGHHIELFAPIIRPAAVVNGKIEYREKLLTFYYIFVKGTLEEVKELCVRSTNNLSFLLNRGSSKRYAIISEADMSNFKIISRAYENEIPFFNLEDIELKEGDLVEVVGGDYDGLRGTFMPKARSNKGNLVIEATPEMGAVVWEIDAKTIRILEFAKDSRRQYDLVDSFIPKSFPILRKFHAQENLSDKEKSQLNVFNLRMGVVKPSNHKAEAKLLAVLMCVQFILGDMVTLAHTQKRYDKCKSTITNIWVLALTELLLAVTQNDIYRLNAAYDTIRNLTEDITNTQRQLLEEFRYYLS